MKTFMKIVGGLVAFVFVIIITIFYFTSGLTDIADQFFVAARQGNMEKAYGYTSKDFRSNTSQVELKKFLKDSSFLDYQEGSWNNRSIQNNTGKLVGIIKTVDGGSLPITMDFVKTDDGWKILGLKKPSSGISEKVKIAQMPSEQGLIKLINDTMLLFAHSIKDKDMQAIRKASSSLFQNQVSLQQFNVAYQSFYKFEDKLLIVEKYSPQFLEKAYVSEKGILHIKGLYPTKPSELNFKCEYVFEGYGWKLLGLNVNIKNSDNK